MGIEITHHNQEVMFRYCFSSYGKIVVDQGQNFIGNVKKAKTCVCFHDVKCLEKVDLECKKNRISVLPVKTFHAKLSFDHAII